VTCLSSDGVPEVVDGRVRLSAKSGCATDDVDLADGRETEKSS
jgi:hypothetical protein